MIQITNDLELILTVDGQYKVKYTSPVTGKSWTNTTSNDIQKSFVLSVVSKKFPLKSELAALKSFAKKSK